MRLKWNNFVLTEGDMAHPSGKIVKSTNFLTFAVFFVLLLHAAAFSSRRSLSISNNGIQHVIPKRRNSSRESSFLTATTSNVVAGRWKEMFNELIRYKSLHGDCLVPTHYSPNPSLGSWVVQQRIVYKRLNNRSEHEEAEAPGSLLEERIKYLDEIEFIWDVPEERWNRRYEKLKEYLTIHGHCNPPPSTPLGAWVAHQRRFYKRESQLLRPSRRDCLNKINFDWDYTHRDPLTWEERFDQLCDFHHQNGHSSVPNPYPENKGLGLWAHNQRLYYQLYLSGRPSPMTRERIESLVGMKFPLEKRKQDWDFRYRQLREYKERYGDCDVPRTYSTNNLGIWVLNQRSQYRYFVQGKKNSLTEEKIQRLDDLGFIWKNRNDNWLHMMHNLRQFREEHGHIDVNMDEENCTLRLWMGYQRKEYQILTEGGKSSMTEERVQMLDSVGFIWEGKRRGGTKDNGAVGGPSVEDWGELFEKMKDKGITKEGKLKEHWFEGLERKELDTMVTDYGEDDLLALWNEGGDDQEK